MPNDLAAELYGPPKQAGNSLADELYGATPTTSDWRDTPYGFKVKQGEAPTGGPATIRDDGAINFPGQSNWLFHDPKTNQYVPAPSEPTANKGFLSRNFGMDTIKENARNFGVGLDRAVQGGLSGAQGIFNAIPATRQTPEQAQNDLTAAQRVSALVQAMKSKGTPSAEKYQDFGQMAPAMAVSTLAPVAGTSFLARALPGAATFGTGMALSTEGDIGDRAKTAGLNTLAAVAGQGAMEKVAVPLGQTLLNQAGKIPAVGRAARTWAEKLGLPTTPIKPWSEAFSSAPIAGEAVAPTVAPDEITPELVGKTARKAAGKGPGSSAAKTELAEMAQFNPEAKAQADRLGLELPVDVLSDNPQVRAAAGLTRSVAGSEPEAAWRQTLTKAVDRADELMQAHDAHFSAGTTSPGSVSDKVNKSLIAERDAIAKQTSEAYAAVDSAIPKETPVTMDRLASTLADVQREVGQGGMSKQESRLLAMIDDNPTYGRIIREKNLIGQALSGQKSPYGDMETGALKRLYGALAEDQLANVGTVAGDAVRSQLHGANLLFAKQKGLESRIVGSFGNTMDGSIAGQMRSAIIQGAKGDTKDFLKLIKTVPEDLHRETLITALADATRSGRGSDRGGFGFSEFTKTWRGIQANPTVYNRMEKALGPETMAMLNDLRSISERLTDARANVLTTGKANQALVGSMAKQTAFNTLLDSAVGEATTTAAGAVGGGAVGAAGAGLLRQALTKGGRDPLRAVGNLFNSTDFLRLVEKVSSGAKPSGAVAESVVLNPKFQAFASHVKDMPKGTAQQASWLVTKLSAGPKSASSIPLSPAASTEPSSTLAENK